MPGRPKVDPEKIRKLHAQGVSINGIAARCGLLPHQVNKRLGELAKAGRIVQTGRQVTSSSGRGEREWRCA
jgi:predicted Rossmann fold nucleotide-binding protein DprA/Smf involved in DNA uptake